MASRNQSKGIGVAITKPHRKYVGKTKKACTVSKEAHKTDLITILFGWLVGWLVGWFCFTVYQPFWVI